MELRQLRYFAVLADEGSFTRAAGRLLISQPSLSKQIRQLERQLGYTLVERGPRGVTLTSAGKALRRHAGQMLALDETTHHLLSDAATSSETVSIGVPPGISESDLVRVVRRLDALLPALALTYLESNSVDQLQLLDYGKLDIGIVHQAPPENYHSSRLWSESLGLALRPGHPLATQVSLSLQDLDGLRILLHSRSQVRTQQDGVLGAAMTAQVWPRWKFAQFTEHALACAEAVRADAAMVNRHTARHQLPGWEWAPIDGPLPPLSTWLVYRQNSATEAVAQVAEVATEVLRSSSEHGDPVSEASD